MAIADDGAARPPRMRASERRGQLAHVAAHRFHQLGYHAVSLGSVATEVGLTGPAVYRHFRNKQALLAAAIASGLDLVEDALLRTTGGTLDDLVAAVANASLERPDLWVLLQRESRYLNPDLRAQIDAQFARVIDGFVKRVRKESPSLSDEDARLLVTAATTVLSTPATATPTLPRTEYRRELSAAALTCLRFDLTTVEPRPAAPFAVDVAGAERTRRSEIVEAATDLFYRRGYTGVSLDDIGSAVGMAGPSILHYFETKSAILVAAFDRATEILADEGRRLESGPAGLSEVVDSYVQFCLHNRSLVGVYVSDAMNLSSDALERTRSIIRQDITAWTSALQRISADLDDRQARVRVQAAMGAVHDLVRLGHFASRPRIADEIAALALAVLLR